MEHGGRRTFLKGAQAPSFDRSGTATEGQAFLLLMEAARREWAAAA